MWWLSDTIFCFLKLWRWRVPRKISLILDLVVQGRNNWLLLLWIVSFEERIYFFAHRHLPWREKSVATRSSFSSQMVIAKKDVFLNFDWTHGIVIIPNSPSQLVLARKMSFYIVTYYLPSGLFVVVSWISFLVNPEVTWAETITKYFQLLLNQRGLKSLSCVFLPIAKVCQLKVIPGRMTLLITIFLVLINIFNTIQTNSPQVKKRKVY